MSHSLHTSQYSKANDTQSIFVGYKNRFDWVLPTDVEAKLTFVLMLIGSFVNLIWSYSHRAKTHNARLSAHPTKKARWIGGKFWNRKHRFEKRPGFACPIAVSVSWEVCPIRDYSAPAGRNFWRRHCIPLLGNFIPKNTVYPFWATLYQKIPILAISAPVSPHFKSHNREVWLEATDLGYPTPRLILQKNRSRGLPVLRCPA